MLLFSPWAASSKPEKQSINVLNWTSSCKRKHCLKQQGEDKSLFPSRGTADCTYALIHLSACHQLTCSPSQSKGVAEEERGQPDGGAASASLGKLNLISSLGSHLQDISFWTGCGCLQLAPAPGTQKGRVVAGTSRPHSTPQAGHCDRDSPRTAVARQCPCQGLSFMFILLSTKSCSAGLLSLGCWCISPSDPRSCSTKQWDLPSQSGSGRERSWAGNILWRCNGQEAQVSTQGQGDVFRYKTLTAFSTLPTKTSE